jgi:spore coat protein F
MKASPKHLAWHETLELHELVVYQAAHLTAFKKQLPTLKDAELAALYKTTIKALEMNLKDLLHYYPQAPMTRADAAQPEMAAIESALLLGFVKTAVRYYAFAITETATPHLRDTLHKHLNQAIALHAQVFNFMYGRGYYPAYNLDQLLANDVKMAQTALKL